MNRRLVLQTASALAFTSAAALAGAQTASPKRHKLVMQVSDADPAKWALALNNARNVQESVGAANVDLEIVAYGPGIGMLKQDSVVASRLKEASDAGVKLMACQNTMRNQKLVAADMSPVVGYVPAGVTELMFKQAEGWAYIRP
jgi:intracellular sulfur oxidation DsrE/DsrF family protein